MNLKVGLIDRGGRQSPHSSHSPLLSPHHSTDDHRYSQRSPADRIRVGRRPATHPYTPSRVLLHAPDTNAALQRHQLHCRRPLSYRCPAAAAKVTCHRRATMRLSSLQVSEPSPLLPASLFHEL
ncbi:hypothetical protein ACSQ67_016641 [Phaseolus vulgaris]